MAAVFVAGCAERPPKASPAVCVPAPATKYLPVPKDPPADQAAVAICDLRPEPDKLVEL